MEVHLDGKQCRMWERIHVKAGQRLKIGKSTGPGCRSYLAIHGGLLNVASYFGSKSTSPLVGIGGYQGRQLAPGDLLKIVDDFSEALLQDLSLPESLIPSYTKKWKIAAMVGISRTLGDTNAHVVLRSARMTKATSCPRTSI